MRTQIYVAGLFALAACSHHSRPAPLVPEASLDPKKPEKTAPEESIPQPSVEVLAGRMSTLPQQSPIPPHAMAMLIPTDGYKVSGTLIADEALDGVDLQVDLQGVPEGTYSVNLQTEECGAADAKPTSLGTIEVGKDGLAKLEVKVPEEFSAVIGRAVVLTNQYDAQLACGVIADIALDDKELTP